jgi:hypothetical protein
MSYEILDLQRWQPWIPGKGPHFTVTRKASEDDLLYGELFPLV